MNNKNSTIIQEIEHPTQIDWDLVDKWAEGIPCFGENDPLHPEWRATPTFPVDLSPQGYGLVHVKDESDKTSNPTQTVKDRAAWELTCLYRDYARSLYLQGKAGFLNGNIGSLIVPRLSLITAGNAGRAVSDMFKKYELPPIKLIVDSSIPMERLEILKTLHADIYMVDLSERELTAKDIKRITHNENGVDITSVKSFEPQAIFYDWHVHEAFNECPNDIYVPYGSGRLMENYLTWQYRTIRNAVSGTKDPRLRVPAERVASMNIFGAEPERQDSIADKLTAEYKPFTIFDDHDMSALADLQFTGRDTGVYQVPEERIRQAYSILSRVCDTPPSGSAELALYLQRFDEGKVDPRRNVLIVNTGKGI